MKQDKCLFLTATIASILSLYDANAYADKVVCPAGKMLPAGYEYCVDCTASTLTLYIPDNANPNTFYCPGGVFMINTEKNQGIQICSAESLADSDHKRCEKRKIVSARAAFLKSDIKSNNSIALDTSSLKSDMKANNSIALDTASLKSDLKIKTSAYQIEKVIQDKGLLATAKDTDQLKNQLKSLMISCPSGKYLPANANKCSDCKDRYYCLGGTFLPLNSDQGLKACTASSKNKACTKSSSSKRVSCNAGQYLPANASSCKECKDRYYCLGGTFNIASYDQGRRVCSSNLTPNSKHTACEKKKPVYVSCNAGSYLPINQNHCADCLAGYYCEGGKWLPEASMNNGLTKCADGLVSSKGSKKSSDCIKPVPDMVTCEAGKYLPAKAKECKECSGTNKYCPGVGPVRPSDLLDQGIKVCPLNTSPNKTKSACQITLTKDMLRFGLGKTSSSELDEQCWIKKEIADYEKCMFGGKINIVAPASSEK